MVSRRLVGEWASGEGGGGGEIREKTKKGGSSKKVERGVFFGREQNSRCPELEAPKIRTVGRYTLWRPCIVIKNMTNVSPYPHVTEQRAPSSSCACVVRLLVLDSDSETITS